MIVCPPSFEGSRTVWSIELEAEDIAPPQSRLWIEGFVRSGPVDIEALALALIFGQFAGKRLVLPLSPSADFCNALEAFLGIAIVVSVSAGAENDGENGFTAALVRDPFDLCLSSLARRPADITLEYRSTPSEFGTAPGVNCVISNAGTLLRHDRPLERLGDLASCLLLAPTLRLRKIACFYCSEELGDIDVDGIANLAKRTGVEIQFPLAGMSVHRLAQLSQRFRIPTILTFRSLWRRYRMFPSVIGALYRELEAALPVEERKDPSMQIAAYMSRVLTGEDSAFQGALLIEEEFFQG